MLVAAKLLAVKHDYQVNRWGCGGICFALYRPAWVKQKDCQRSYPADSHHRATYQQIAGFLASTWLTLKQISLPFSSFLSKVHVDWHAHAVTMDFGLHFEQQLCMCMHTYLSASLSISSSIPHMNHYWIRMSKPESGTKVPSPSKWFPLCYPFISTIAFSFNKKKRLKSHHHCVK